MDEFYVTQKRGSAVYGSLKLQMIGRDASLYTFFIPPFFSRTRVSEQASGGQPAISDSSHGRQRTNFSS